MLYGQGRSIRRALFIFAGTSLTLLLILFSADHNYYSSRWGQKWDDRYVLSWDWTETEDEIKCRALGRAESRESTTTKVKPIPNLVHFVILSNEGQQYELSYSSFLAIKAAVLRMNAAEVKVHTYDNGINVENEWWLNIKEHVTLIQFERPLRGPAGLATADLPLAHQSDLARLDILKREGGIYLDTDMFVIKPFADLLDSPRDILLGHEGANRYGLCNAVILAQAGSDFIRIWQETYKSYDPRLWNEHSVCKPKQLQRRHPDLICPLSPTVFFWPTWHTTHVSYMYEPIGAKEVSELRANLTAFGAMYENQLAVHAWSTHEYLKNLAPGDLEKDTRFNILMRDVARAELNRV